MHKEGYHIKRFVEAVMMAVIAFVLPQSLRAAGADNDTVSSGRFPAWYAFEGREVLFSLSEKVGGRQTVLSIDSVAVAPHRNDTVSLTMKMRLMGHRLPQDCRVRVVPHIVADSDSLSLPAAELLGRWAYYHTLRSGIADDAADMQWRDRDVLEAQTYIQLAAVRPWMLYAGLRLEVQLLNGCGDVLSEECRQLVEPTAPVAEELEELIPADVEPARADTTTVMTAGGLHQFQGSAIIDFVVNRTEIDPDYRDNRRRLEQIHITIDSVLTRERATLRRITLKGFASPEGSYASNARLASGRVTSLQRYLSDNFGIPSALITTDYEPEDWEGLRRYVEASGLSDREPLLAIIDGSLDPDAKLQRIAARHRASYQFLLKNVFPALRHTDYVIEYDVEEDSTMTKVIKMVVPTPLEKIEQVAAKSRAEGVALDGDLGPAPEPTASRIATIRPWLAVKTNMLFDLALTPNLEVEMPFGRDAQWSVMAEVWFPWWRTSHNPAGDINPYLRSDQRPTRNSYELLTIGAELRYWFWPTCQQSRPLLSGAFAGLYAAGGKYDIERDSEGYQGEFTSLGLTAGYSWPLARRLNLEVSASLGYVGGPQRHYVAEFDDTHLIFRNYDSLRYVGPTKLKVSICWLLGR